MSRRQLKQLNPIYTHHPRTRKRSNKQEDEKDNVDVLQEALLKQAQLAGRKSSSSSYMSFSPSKSSLSFRLTQVPLLFLSLCFILSNIFVYASVRQYVWMKEVLLGLFSKTSQLKRDLRKVNSYPEWKEKATLLDRELGLEGWKFENFDEDSSFDEKLLLKMTNRLYRARLAGQTQKVLTALHTACKADMAGQENRKLYNRCYSGTKISIDLYVEETIKALKYIRDSDDIEPEQKETVFDNCASTYGSSALCLSGGAILGWYHLGVVRALHENNVLPKILTGSSAGALIASIVCVRTDRELEEFFDDPNLAGTLKFMSETWAMWIGHFLRGGKNGSEERTFTTCEFLRTQGAHLSKGDTTFLEAYLISGRILNIPVTNHELGKTKMLNYLTAPHVTVLSAAIASSALPLLVEPAKLYAKDLRGLVSVFTDFGESFRDGSLTSDVPHRELEHLGVMYKVVSQVNPHVALFMFSGKGDIGAPIKTSLKGGFLAGSLVRYTLLDINKWLKFIRDLQILPTFFGTDFSRLFLQSFHGNVTIAFPQSYKYFRVLMSDPSREALEDFKRDGQLQTFPTIAAISNRVRIEKTIQACRDFVKEEQKRDLREIDLKAKLETSSKSKKRVKTRDISRKFFGIHY